MGTGPGPRSEASASPSRRGTKMARGRKAHLDPPVQVFIHLPRSLVAKMELLLADTLTMKPRYGARSALFERLLREWLVQRATEQPNSTDVDNSI